MRQLKITKQVTNREAVSLDKYLHEISKVNLLTPEEEVSLARRIRKGDKVALNKLIRANLRFVVSVAKQYQNQGLSLSDLINEGNLGLMKAADRFDETKGFKFISYAVWWIRQSILQALAEQARIVRLPLNKIGSISKISKIFTSLEQRYERPPTNDEIARELQIAPKDVHIAMRNMNRHISMDAPIGQQEEGDGDMYEVFITSPDETPDSELLTSSLRNEIERMLAILSIREADIIRYYFGLNGKYPKTLEEIGEEFSLTRERVRQIKEKAIKKLKQTSKSQVLKNILDY